MGRTMTESLIHLRIPAAIKGRWVSASRAAGMRLTDYIRAAVEAYMSQVTIVIPDDLQFSDLKLARDADGALSFDWAPIERICAASGVDVAVFRDGPEYNVSGLIVRWYMVHLEHGGERDPVQDDLINETIVEEAHGQAVSHAPGRA